MTNWLLAEAKPRPGLQLFWGIILLLLGIAALGAPVVASTIAVQTIGGALVLGGIAQFLHARLTLSSVGIFAGLLGGFLSILAGCFIMFRPLLGLSFVSMLLTLYFLAEGLALAVVSLKLRPSPGWPWILVNGVLTIILGAMFWQQWPLFGIVAMGVLIGLHLLFAGMSVLLIWLAVRSITSNAPAGTIGQ